MTDTPTDQELAEIETRQKFRRTHGAFGRIYDDLSLAFAALCAERDARRDQGITDARQIAELRASLEIAQDQAEEMRERAEAAERKRDEARQAAETLRLALNEISETGPTDEECAFIYRDDLWPIYDDGLCTGLARMGKLARAALADPVVQRVREGGKP